MTCICETTNGEVLRLKSNGGHLDSKQKAKFDNISTWFNPKCLANILSLALVSDMYRVTMDTDVENCLVVHVSDSFQMRFHRNEDDLYVFDASKVESYGRVVKRAKGDMTIMLLSGYNTLKDARAATEKAIASGFTGAHVVLEDDGKLIKI